MNPTETIRVALGDRSYDIVVRSGGLNDLSEFAQLFDTHHAVIITDENVAGLYLEQVEHKLGSLIDRVDTIKVPVGESSKSVQQLESIWNQFLGLQVDRQTMVFALGGGVVGDLAGFVAASFARGIRFVQIPTSLLAHVDSSVGGKTGINLAGAKNMVGAFWQPEFVLIDPDTLNTLDDANYTSGLAEVVKYGVIMDPDFFATLEKSAQAITQRDSAVLTQVIAQCCRLKSQIVVEDEKETTGRRAILNYGHTFGHAIESVFGYGTYLHGHAVAIGMQCAAILSASLGMVDKSLVTRQLRLLTALNCPTQLSDGDVDKLVAAMHRDKKVQRGKLKLILPTAIGKVELIDAPDDEMLRQAFQANSGQ